MHDRIVIHDVSKELEREYKKMELSRENKTRNINISELISLLKQNVFLLAGLCLIFGLTGFGAAKFAMTPVYEAEAKMIVNTGKEEGIDITSDQITSAKNLVGTYSIIIRSRTVLMPVIENLNLSFGYEELQKKVTVTAMEGTQVMEITARDSNPELAEKIVAEILKISPQIIMDTVEAGSVKTIEGAYQSGKEVAPDKLKITVISALLGFMTAVVIITFRFWSDNTYRSAQDIEEDIGIPVLGKIPSMESCAAMERKEKGRKGRAEHVRKKAAKKKRL